MAATATSTRLIVGATILLVASAASPRTASANADRQRPWARQAQDVRNPVLGARAAGADGAPLGSCGGDAAGVPGSASDGRDRLCIVRLADLPASFRERFPWAPAPAFETFGAFEDSPIAWPARPIVRFAAAYVLPASSAARSSPG